MEAIKTTNLVKKYGNKRVVDNLNLCVPEGAVYGFIGRNGAGKSTTQKIVCGLANASGGEVKLFGKSIDNIENRKKIGTLIEQPGVYPGMTALENVILQGYNIGISEPEKAAKRALTEVGLGDVMKKKAKHLSLGMRQRLGLAVAMLGEPELLVLDEPINGLDPEGIVQFREIIEKLNYEKGITIFISSHILGELSKIATHYGIIKDGKLVEQVTAQELTRKRKDYLKVKVKDAENAAVYLERQLNVKQCEICSDQELHIYDCFDTGKVTTLLSRQGFELTEIYLHQQDLEEYFINLMGGKDNE